MVKIEKNLSDETVEEIKRERERRKKKKKQRGGENEKNLL